MFFRFILAAAILSPTFTSAQTAISNGVNQNGTLQVGGLDTWTFAGNKDDGIAVSVAKVIGGGSDSFYPWIRLNGPDGARVAEVRATLSLDNIEQIHTRLPLSGTYTVLVANGNTEQQGPVAYVLTMAKTAGPYVVSAGDEGGPLTNGVHSGSLFVGDLDPWAVQAAQNDRIVVSLGKAGTGSSGFFPSLRFRAPDGTLLAYSETTLSSENSVQIDQRAPMTGTYTIFVTNGVQGRDQTSPASYTLTLSGPSTGFSLASIIPVAGSLQGNGAYFRTRLQLHNARTTAISGKLVFHTASVSGKTSDPSLSYTLNGGQTIDYLDLLPAMGVSSGLGSIDLYTNPGDPVPVISARVFSDFGAVGTNGFFIDALGPDTALQAGDTGLLIAPADAAAARLNIGVRSLDSGASLTITVRNKNGTVRNTVTKTYLPTFFEQVGANGYVGVTLDGSDTIAFTVNAGKAIIYGAQTDNKTQDPPVQYAKKVF
jgi:hypothetical protein